MSEDTIHIVTLCEVFTELEAASISNALLDAGIVSSVTGGFTARMVVEISSSVQVKVDRADLEKARNIYHSIASESEKIDWSRVDVGSESEAEK